MAYIAMACIAMAADGSTSGSTYIIITYTVMAFIVIAYTVMAYKVIAHIVVVYTVPADMFMAADGSPKQERLRPCACR